MPEFVPAENTIFVELAYDLEGQHVNNTLWFKHRAGAITVPDMEAFATAMNSYWVDAMMPFLASNLSYVGVIVIDQTTETSPGINVPAGPAAGGAGAIAATNSVAFCVKFLTAGRGKSSRGRNYVPGISIADLADQNHVSAGLATNLVGVYAGILGSPMDADWEWSVVSHFTGGLPRTTALIQPIIGAGATDLIVDSQRRRLPGRGT